MKRTRTWMLAAAVTPLLVGAWQATVVAQTRPTTQPAEDPSEEIVDTFVLSPIQSEAIGMEVPAAMLNPIQNGSCRDWAGRSESCYLPPRVLSEEGTSNWPQKSLRRLLERHTSSILGAYKVGSWPAGGGSVSYDLVRKAILEHCWLATRIELSEAINGLWITAKGDPNVLPWQAVGQPDATFKVEIFDEVHDAAGYPRKTGP